MHESLMMADASPRTLDAIIEGAIIDTPPRLRRSISAAAQYHHFASLSWRRRHAAENAVKKSCHGVASPERADGLPR